MGWISTSPEWGLDNLTAQDPILPCSESSISVGIVGLSKNPSHALPMGRTGGVRWHKPAAEVSGFPRKCVALLAPPLPSGHGNVSPDPGPKLLSFSTTYRHNCISSSTNHKTLQLDCIAGSFCFKWHVRKRLNLINNSRYFSEQRSSKGWG